MTQINPSPLATSEPWDLIASEYDELVRPLHNRMPVIVPAERWEEWLSAETPYEELVELLQPYAGKDLAAYEVSTLVNNPANDDPECIEPLAPADREESQARLL